MSTPKFFDVHTHLQFAAFAKDKEAVIQRALDAGTWLVNVGTQRDTSKNAFITAERYKDGVYASVGLHPSHTEKSYHDPKELGDSAEAKGFTSRGEDFDYDYYRKLVLSPKTVAIGECGLDYYRSGPETKGRQKAAFFKQIELAGDVKKPLMIHCRNAFDDLISILEERRSALPVKPGIIHFFSGSVDDAKKLLELGFLFSFGGVITFARDYDLQIKHIPMDRILLETDSPYVAPLPYRGKRNESAYVIEVAKKVAEIKNMSLDEVGKLTTANARELFAV